MDDSSNLTPYAELGPIRRSTSSEAQQQNLAEIKKLVAHLGLRYRPSTQTDLEAHAALLALLVVDVAGVDHRDLAEAIKAHVRQSPFMPKACELIELADRARANREYAERPRLPPLEYTPPPEPEPFVPCTAEEADAIMREYGLKANPVTDPGHFVDRQA